MQFYFREAGWLLASYDGNSGVVPANYIKIFARLVFIFRLKWSPLYHIRRDIYCAFQSSFPPPPPPHTQLWDLLFLGVHRCRGRGEELYHPDRCNFKAFYLFLLQFSLLKTNVVRFSVPKDCICRAVSIKYDRYRHTDSLERLPNPNPYILLALQFTVEGQQGCIMILCIVIILSSVHFFLMSYLKKYWK